MHPTCLPQLALPVELIERTLGFLKDDIVALNRAALTCKGLLPICRTLILSEVTVPVLDGTVPQPRRQTRFLELIDTTPLLALYVRSLTIDMPPDGVYVPLWTAVNVWEKLPNLRTLTFRRVGNGPNGNVPLRLSNLPSLETLVLDDISGSILREIARARGTPKPPSPLMHIHPEIRLRRLCITGGNFSPSLLVDLAEDMLKNGTHASLESVDLQWSYLYAEPSIRPLRAWAKIFAALGPQLRHCGLSIACDRASLPDFHSACHAADLSFQVTLQPISGPSTPVSSLARTSARSRSETAARSRPSANPSRLTPTRASHSSTSSPTSSTSAAHALRHSRT